MLHNNDSESISTKWQLLKDTHTPPIYKGFISRNCLHEKVYCGPLHRSHLPSMLCEWFLSWQLNQPIFRETPTDDESQRRIFIRIQMTACEWPKRPQMTAVNSGLAHSKQHCFLKNARKRTGAAPSTNHRKIGNKLKMQKLHLDQKAQHTNRKVQPQVKTNKTPICPVTVK